MSEKTPTNPTGGSAGPLPVDEVPGLADLILYLDGLLSDEQAVEVHKLLADIHGTTDQTALSTLSGMPDGPSPGAAMDAARNGRIGRAHPKPQTELDRLYARFPSMPRLPR